MFGVVCVHFIYEQNAKHKKENNNIKSIIVSIGRICWDVFITLYPFKFPHIVVLYTCVSLGQPKKNGRQLYYVLLCWFGEVTWKELRSSTNWHVFCLMANKKNKQLRNIFLKKKKGSNKKLLKIVGSLISSTSAYRVLCILSRGAFLCYFKKKKKNDWNGGDKEAWLILGDIVVVVGWRGSLCPAESICIV